MNYDPIHDTFVGKAEEEMTALGAPPHEPTPPILTRASVSQVQHIPPQQPPMRPIHMKTGQPNSALEDGETEPEHDTFDEPDHDGSTMSSPGPEHEERKKVKARRPVSASIPKGVRYLKKSDGEPFWRKDIQYDFLDALFEDTHRVFTNPFPYCSVSQFHNGPKYTFAELYVRTLAESSKCSKILKERLLRDTEMGKSVGKVCLLVNAGRMNTTINFVPEMRSTLRTYHSIPSLQADPANGGSKPLQDTPRLKSILKAVSDAKEDYKSLEDLLASPSAVKPNTNLVLLLFLLSNNIHGIRFHHEHTPDCHHVSNSFMEFFLETRIHPVNRARRFLWLIYTYLETSFKPEELANNPFNPNEIPPIEYVPDEELNNFDKDTDYEIEYSERMYRTRLKYLADEEHNSNPKRGNKSKKDREQEEEASMAAASTVKSLDDLEDGEKKRHLPQESKANQKRKKLITPVPSVSSPLSRAVINSASDRSHHDDDNSGLDSRSSFALPKFNKLANLPKIELDFDEPDPFLSKANRRALISKAKMVARYARASEEELTTGRNFILDWVNKYFQYKKSTRNGLVDMEWEEIRYDIIHHLEAHLYQQRGNELFNTESSEIPQEASNSFEPSYDFEKANEKSQYIHNVLSRTRRWIDERTTEQLVQKKNQKIKIDLSNDDIVLI